MELDKQKKKDLASAYAQSWRPMGVYQIRNTVNGKIYVDGTMDLDGARNRLAFMQKTNMNKMLELRQDWSAHGAAAFVFEELDRISPREDSNGDRGIEQRGYKEEVDALLELWLEKLQPYGDQGYNRRPRA